MKGPTIVNEATTRRMAAVN